MPQPEKIAKVRALLDSDHAGERAAAAAALERMQNSEKVDRPTRGSPAWIAAAREFRRKIGHCDARRASPKLSRADLRLVRNWARYGGTPFDRGAGEIERIYAMLKDEVIP